MAVRWVVVVAVVSGCYQPALDEECRVSCPITAPVGDSTSCPDGLACYNGRCRSTPATACAPTVDGNSDRFCYGQHLVKVCLESEPTAQPVFTGAVEFDTNDTPMNCTIYDPDGDPERSVCMIAARSITFTTGANVTAHGKRPLVLLATTSFIHSGAIALTGSMPTPAAGANPSVCATTMLPTTPGGGGGAGGTFGARGGDGGDGDQGTNQGGLANPPVGLASVRGGCDGQPGGGSSDTEPGGGGGAIYILGTNITVAGVIDASGGGAFGPSNGRGGSGGGAGGLIGIEVLDDSFLSLTGAQLWANGGGGACGASTSGPGGNGGPSAGPTTPGVGCLSGPGGSGGDGGYATRSFGVPGTDGSSTRGGGGGGGGVGVIAVYPQARVPLPTASISPNATSP